MEALIVLVLLVLLALVVMPVWLFVKLHGQSRDVRALHERVGSLEEDIRQLRSKPTLHEPAAPIAPTFVASPATPTTAAIVLPPPLPPLSSDRPVTALPPVAPPPLPTPLTAAAPPRLSTPPPSVLPRPQAPVRAKPAINWEQFMGAKLFAWLGGLALFLGVAFFVKYSVEHQWIPPEVRVALGFVFGAGLIVGGLMIPRARYAITAQTLIAAGVVSLYAVTFTCGKDHYDFLGPVAMFLVMSLITATAFLLAVRLRAPVVAILGLLGGFLTPILLSTGVDNPGGLFGYLALLDAGLLAVVLATGWRYLVPLSAGGTVLMMLGWAERFLTGEKGPVAMIVCVGFSVLYLAGAAWARRRGQTGPAFSWTAAALPLVGFGFGFAFLAYPEIAGDAPLFLGYVLLLDLLLLAQAWRDETMPGLPVISGLVGFALLAAWTGGHLTDALLSWALAGYLVFGALHTVFPLLLQRRRPAASAVWSQVFPALSLLLMMLPFAKLDDVSFLLWPAILLIDVLAIVVAAISASLVAVATVLVLTLLATGLFVFKVPVDLAFEPSLLLVIGGFALFFFGASLWLVHRLGARLPTAGRDRAWTGVFGDPRAQLPAFSSLLPFLLLIMVCSRLSVPDPAAVFGLGLLLVVLTLGVAAIMVSEWLPACALAGMTALEFAWHGRHFAATQASAPLAWYLVFYAAFAVYPFLFRRRFAALTGPWAVAALSGMAHFYLVYQALKPAWPADLLGLIPALFVIAPLASLFVMLKSPTGGTPAARLNQLAWLGGVALFFVTLVFPIQFERQWLTVAWALEGAALAWLFRRVPHPGLRATGVVLLVTAFVRLALNPAVLAYHLRGETAFFNWYFYAYGLATAALFIAARLLAPPRHRTLGMNAPVLLTTLGVILAFLLLNIEIADYFTSPGTRSLAFQFSGNFARDMSYTIAWALFALGLLVAGIWKQSRAARYAAIVLLSVALLKLFLHDLAQLAQLYRIGALFAVAVIALVASLAYQRFLPSHEKTPPTP